MKGRIPQAFIDDLIARADIVDIIHSRVPLKKKGREYTACCPFHNEKTPSFTVSEAKQFYHCFGCGAHGTAIGFLMEYENLDFVEAIEQLAAEYHLEVPREGGGSRPQQQDERRALLDLLQQAKELYREELRKAPAAVEYLKNRGLVGEIARDYQLGFAPDDWQFLIGRLGDTPGRIQQLKSAGLVIESERGKTYDRFRNRVMFPIHDRRGNCIGFGGRIIGEGEPKYLNSPETPVFHKGQGLYGYHEARKSVRNLERLIVVEGYMDVVALAQNGIANAVATLGTATTQEQVLQLFRTVSEIVFCYDGDAAGRKAAWRALEQCLPVMRDGYHARFLFLPEGEDPDSLVREEGRDAFHRRLDTARPLSEFLFDELAGKHSLDSVEGRAALEKEAKTLLGRLPESVYADLMWSRLAELVGIDEKRLEADRTATHRPEPPARRAAAQRERPVRQSAMRDAIALLLQYPSVHAKCALPDAFGNADIEGMPLLYRIHELARDNPDITPAALLERFRDDPGMPILQKLMQRNIVGSDDLEQRTHIYRDAIRSLRRKLVEHRYESRARIIQQKIEQSGFQSLTGDEKREYQACLDALKRSDEDEAGEERE